MKMKDEVITSQLTQISKIRAVVTTSTVLPK